MSKEHLTPFKKGQTGNPNGAPKKMVSLLGAIGYTKAEAANTINAMLAMNLNELKAVYENENATILEKTIAGALKKSLMRGSLYSVDTLLSRTHGKPKEMLEITAETKNTLIVQFGSHSTIQSPPSTMEGT